MARRALTRMGAVAALGVMAATLAVEGFRQGYRQRFAEAVMRAASAANAGHGGRRRPEAPLAGSMTSASASSSASDRAGSGRGSSSTHWRRPDEVSRRDQEARAPGYLDADVTAAGYRRRYSSRCQQRHTATSEGVSRVSERDGGSGVVRAFCARRILRCASVVGVFVWGGAVLTNGRLKSTAASSRSGRVGPEPSIIGLR